MTHTARRSHLLDCWRQEEAKRLDGLLPLEDLVADMSASRANIIHCCLSMPGPNQRVQLRLAKGTRRVEVSPDQTVILAAQDVDFRVVEKQWMRKARE